MPTPVPGTVFDTESWMDCSLLFVAQPTRLNASNRQANAARRVFNFTAKYLRKEIYKRILAASVTFDKVTKVTAVQLIKPSPVVLSSRPLCTLVSYRRTCAILMEIAID